MRAATGAGAGLAYFWIPLFLAHIFPVQEIQQAYQALELFLHPAQLRGAVQGGFSLSYFVVVHESGPNGYSAGEPLPARRASCTLVPIPTTRHGHGFAGLSA